MSRIKKILSESNDENTKNCQLTKEELKQIISWSSLIQDRAVYDRHKPLIEKLKNYLN